MNLIDQRIWYQGKAYVLGNWINSNKAWINHYRDPNLNTIRDYAMAHYPDGNIYLFYAHDDARIFKFIHISELSFDMPAVTRVKYDAISEV